MNNKVWILTGTDDGGIPWSKPFTTRERAIDFLLRDENEIASEDGEDYMTVDDLNPPGSHHIASAENTFSGTNYMLSEEELDQ